MYQSVLYTACWELVATTGAFNIILSFVLTGTLLLRWLSVVSMRPVGCCSLRMNKKVTYRSHGKISHYALSVVFYRQVSVRMRIWCWRQSCTCTWLFFPLIYCVAQYSIQHLRFTCIHESPTAHCSIYKKYLRMSSATLQSFYLYLNELSGWPGHTKRITP